MGDHWAGEGVLGVGVNVHLDDAVAQGLLDLLLLGTGATVEDEVEWVGAGCEAEFLLGDLLAHVEDLWAQLHVAWLVYAVDVAEGCGQQVAAVLAGAEGIDGLLKVLFAGVQVRAGLSLDAVFFATDDADLDLEDDVGLVCLLQELLGDLKVVVDWDGGAVPHVGLEQWVLAAVDALLGDRDEWADVLVENLELAVVGVQRNVDVVVLSDLMCERSKRLGTSNLVLHGQARAELCAAGRELDDAVRLGFCETTNCGVDGLRRGAVDGRVCEPALLCSVEHLVVDLRGCNWHEDNLH